MPHPSGGLNWLLRSGFVPSSLTARGFHTGPEGKHSSLADCESLQPLQKCGMLSRVSLRSQHGLSGLRAGRGGRESSASATAFQSGNMGCISKSRVFASCRRSWRSMKFWIDLVAQLRGSGHMLLAYWPKLHTPALAEMLGSSNSERCSRSVKGIGFKKHPHQGRTCCLFAASCLRRSYQRKVAGMMGATGPDHCRASLHGMCNGQIAQRIGVGGGHVYPPGTSLPYCPRAPASTKSSQTPAHKSKQEVAQECR